MGDDPKKTAGAWEETVGVLIRCSQFSQGSRWRGHSPEQRGREENSWRRMKAMEKAVAWIPGQRIKGPVVIKGLWQAPSPLTSKVPFACSPCPAPLAVLQAMSKSTLQAERPLKGLKGGETAQGKINCFEIANEHDIADARTL